MFRKPAFWVVFALVSASAAVFAWQNFSRSFPLVSIDISMDRNAALDATRMLAARYAWPPAGFRQAASFSVDQKVQNFVELEGGGKDALRKMIVEKTYAPYAWTVRDFREGDPHEVSVRFTPEGRPYGFAVRLPEKEAGASLEADAARAIAERAAVNDWHVDLATYPLAESSEMIRPSGRKDHTFVYERQDIRIGEGRYRLRLVVAGDKLTELTYFVLVPEAFSRRYDQMRSANEAISAVATIGVIVYLLGLCGAGLFFMMRQRWLIWRPALMCGVAVAALAALGELNSWPLIWMDYDTALSASGFALQRIAAIVGSFLVNALVFSISFMAAETLSRRAFPNHIQFWNVWKRPAAGSRETLGRTVGGYLTVSLFIAYIIVFYGFTQRTFGWWIPSDTMVNPDVFAAYVPSFSAIALAAQAGFWEECLFRAVPLATFALIGDRFGKRRGFLIAGMVVQALVFGSGHAGYANQPAYARVVELIIPSFTFGTYFLAFGLLPGIVMHFAFDTVLMSLPIFASTTPRAHLEQLLVAILIFVPLWVVLRARILQGRWLDLPDDQRNRAWRPAALEEPAPVAAAAERQGIVSPAVGRILAAAALIGLTLWIALSHFRSEVPGIAISRAAAEAAARQDLSAQGVQIDSSWTVLSRVVAQPDTDDRFVWQTAGHERYAELLGSYLAAPYWLVRFARFQGDVAERAEEYQVLVSGAGRSFRIRHELPEATPGTTLSQDEARALARSTLQQDFPVSSSALNEISAEANKRPNRGDWAFEFKDTRNYGLADGEPRLAVEIAGNKVVDASRYIHVPEEWERNERRERNLPETISVTLSVLTTGILLIGAILAAIRWSRGGGFSVQVFLVVGGTILLLNLVNFTNNWRTALSQLSTAEPFNTQVGVMVGFAVVSSVVIAAALGLAAGLIGKSTGSSAYSGSDTASGLFTGVLMGIALAGVRTTALAMVPSLVPPWPDFSATGALLPFVAAAIGPFAAFINQTLVLGLVFHAVDYISHGWNRRRTTAVLMLLMMGLMTAGSRSIETIPSWLMAGALIGAALIAAYVLVLRHRPELVLPMVATVSILSVVREGLHRAYPQALAGALAAVLLIVTAVVVFTRARIRAS